MRRAQQQGWRILLAGGFEAGELLLQTPIEYVELRFGINDKGRAQVIIFTQSTSGRFA
jgi:hypothetical protein